MDWEHFETLIDSCVQNPISDTYIKAYTYVFMFITSNYNRQKFVSELIDWFLKNYTNNGNWITAVKFSMSYIDVISINKLFDQLSEHQLMKSGVIWKFKKIFPILLNHLKPPLIDPNKLLTYLVIGLNLDYPCLAALAFTAPSLQI